MTEIIKHPIAQLGGNVEGITAVKLISLPKPPWEGGFGTDSRDETKPRTAPVRGVFRVASDPVQADPVLRHASTRKDNG